MLSKIYYEQIVRILGALVEHCLILHILQRCSTSHVRNQWTHLQDVETDFVINHCTCSISEDGTLLVLFSIWFVFICTLFLLLMDVKQHVVKSDAVKLHYVNEGGQPMCGPIQGACDILFYFHEETQRNAVNTTHVKGRQSCDKVLFSQPSNGSSKCTNYRKVLTSA